MESTILKSQNLDIETPFNKGNIWTDREEKTLLEELRKNIDIDSIAQIHQRTTGGINTRRRVIAYKLYCNNNSIEEIVMKTKLAEDEIMETIRRRQDNSNRSKSMKKIKEPFSIESEITEMKNDIKELKNTIKELVEMMKAVYEFEDA
jgi:hypothetical protein